MAVDTYLRTQWYYDTFFDGYSSRLFLYKFSTHKHFAQHDVIYVYSHRTCVMNYNNSVFYYVEVTVG